jgi:hypothetical protein
MLISVHMPGLEIIIPDAESEFHFLIEELKIGLNNSAW